MRNYWIDTHHHLWHYKAEEYPWMSDRMEVLRHDFSVNDLQVLADTYGVTGTIAVQARQSLVETEWLLEVAESSSLLRGVVGWVPLTDPNVEEHLSKLSKRAMLKGVRHVLHDEIDPDYILRPDFNAGVRLLERYGLRYDLLIFAEHLPQTISFVDRHPNQLFVVDHIAKPRIASGEIEPWRQNLRALAERPNVYCKLSGMLTEADWQIWTQDQLWPYFEVALSAFGVSRLMFGSDWPVVTVAGSYGRWIEVVACLLEGLSDTEASDIMHRTAGRAYSLTSSPNSSHSGESVGCSDQVIS